MPHNFEFITFDCYGTLVDWQGGIGDAFVRAAEADGVRIDVAETLRTYAAIEPVVQSEIYRPYRDVLATAALRVAHTLEWPLSPARAAFLADSLPSWRPFPDTNAALERLREAGYRLGILSNTDDDLIAATRRHLTVDFELVITAQQVRAYKPAPAHFLAARERIGQRSWLHAAQSDFHDIIPANVLGIPNAWINRLGEQPLPGGVPDSEYANLTELADALCS